jgi:hypothetical protein
LIPGSRTDADEDLAVAMQRAVFAGCAPERLLRRVSEDVEHVSLVVVAAVVANG